MALPAAVTTAINACVVKLTQMDPKATAVGNQTKLVAAFNDWPNQTPGIGGWGPAPWTVAKATGFCNWMAAQSVDVTALRTYCGI
jgi:hypothetical protein